MRCQMVVADCTGVLLCVLPARYLVLCDGGQLSPPPALCPSTEAEYAMYERDLGTMQVRAKKEENGKIGGSGGREQGFIACSATGSVDEVAHGAGRDVHS